MSANVVLHFTQGSVRKRSQVSAEFRRILSICFTLSRILFGTRTIPKSLFQIFCSDDLMRTGKIRFLVNRARGLHDANYMGF